METFTPSLDWGDDLITSLLWVAKAWAIAAVCTWVILALIARYTTWGRQFWRISGGYFKGRQSIPVWTLLGVLLASVMIDVRLGVLFSYQSNDREIGGLRVCSSRDRGCVRPGPPAEERALTELSAAGIALTVLGDVRGARPGRVQSRNRATVFA
jgi:ABC-type uncharacterized transport system fused permease/ATPase subunit